MSEQQGIVVSPRLLWAMLSVAAIVAGSLGPWVTVGPFSAGGTNDGGDGIFTLILGILAFGLVIAERSRPAVAAVAGAALAIGVVDTSAVLRLDGNELFSVNPGWGLIVLNLGAASLLVWGVLEIVQGKASRRGIVLVSGTVAMVAIVATAAILAASGRFEDPNDSEQPVAQLQDSEDTEEQPTFDSPSDDDAPVEEPPSEPFSEPSPESDPAAPEDDRAPTPPSSPAQDKTKSCGNLTVTADSITCGFANNVFYEYWVASDGGSSHAANISAYSDALGRYLELACNVGKAVSCVTDADGHVSIPRGALDDYSQADADDYAASNTVSR